MARDSYYADGVLSDNSPRNQRRERCLVLPYAGRRNGDASHFTAYAFTFIRAH